MNASSLHTIGYHKPVVTLVKVIIPRLRLLISLQIVQKSNFWINDCFLWYKRSYNERIKTYSEVIHEILHKKINDIFITST